MLRLNASNRRCLGQTLARWSNRNILNRSINQSLNQSINQCRRSIHAARSLRSPDQSNSQSINQSFNESSNNQSIIEPSNNEPVNQSIDQSVSQSDSINQSINQSIKKLSFNGKSPFVVLGIETTCDDTAMAIVKSSTDPLIDQSVDQSTNQSINHSSLILSQARAEQWDLHTLYGGVHPKEAALMHARKIESVYQSLFDQSTNQSTSQSTHQPTNQSINQSINQPIHENMIDAIAVASGPGLALCLDVGVEFAKRLSMELGVPLIGVNHLLGHVSVAELSEINDSINHQNQSINPSANQSTSQTNQHQPDHSTSENHSVRQSGNQSVTQSVDQTQSVTEPQSINQSINPPESINQSVNQRKFGYPHVSLLISGGHSELVYSRSVDDRMIVGRTVDVALGESFDKVARSMGIHAHNEAPGRTIERMTEGVDLAHMQSINQSISQIKALTVPMKAIKNCDFSFTGLTAAVARSVAELKAINESNNQSINQSVNEAGLTSDQQIFLAASFQSCVISHLSDRVRRCLNWLKFHDPSCKRFIVSGGVASNSAVFHGLQVTCSEFGVTLLRPSPQLCTDNGVMIAWQGINQLARGEQSDRDTLRFLTKWPVGPVKQIEENKKKKGKKASFHLVSRQLQ